MILSIRKDGFGQRVKSLVYAIRVSKAIGHDYQFLWEEKTGGYGKYHDCENAVNIFENNYYHSHVVNEKPNKSMPLNVAQKKMYPLAKDEFYTVNACEAKELSENYKKEFFEIGFSEEIKKAINFALSIDIGEVAKGIHLRGGDICYGPLKGKSIIFQDKVVTIPIAKNIIEESAGDEFIIFCQDLNFKSYFSSYNNVVFASDLKPESMMQGVSSVVFDIILMSRCEYIYAGTSAVPEVAEMIGDSKLVTPENIYPTHKIIEILYRDLFLNDSNYDADLYHFLLINFLYYAVLSSDSIKMVEVSEKMLTVKPDNPQSVLFGYFFNKNLIEKAFLQDSLEINANEVLVRSESILKDCPLISVQLRSSSFDQFTDWFKRIYKG